jgi:prepilin-type N-terminal cleavage/methylation domain-containing protein
VTQRLERKGATLVEMVMAIVIAGILAGLLAVTLREAFAVYDVAGRRKELLQEGRAVLLRAERELRAVRDRGAILEAGPRRLTAITVDDSTVGLSWNGAPGDPLLYWRNGRSYVLAARVDSLALAYWRDDGAAAAPLIAPDSTDVRRLSIFLRLESGGQRVSLRDGLFLRNLAGG